MPQLDVTRMMQTLNEAILPLPRGSFSDELAPVVATNAMCPPMDREPK